MRNFSSGMLMLAVMWIGAAQATNTPQEEADKKLVRDFYTALDAVDYRPRHLRKRDA